MTRDILSREETQIIRKLNEKQLADLAKIAGMAEAKTLNVVIHALVDQSKSVFLTESSFDPVKLAIRHADEKGRISGIQSFINILVHANAELNRRQNKEERAKP